MQNNNYYAYSAQDTASMALPPGNDFPTENNISWERSGTSLKDRIPYGMATNRERTMAFAGEHHMRQLVPQTGGLNCMQVSILGGRPDVQGIVKSGGTCYGPRSDVGSPGYLDQGTTLISAGWEAQRSPIRYGDRALYRPSPGAPTTLMGAPAPQGMSGCGKRNLGKSAMCGLMDLPPAGIGGFYSNRMRNDGVDVTRGGASCGSISTLNRNTSVCPY